MRFFETVIVRDEVELTTAHKLRYQVYCVENAFEDPADSIGGLERDLFDERSSHCLLVHRPSGTVVGAVRLVLPDRQRLHESFALQQVCTDPLTRAPERFPVERMAEISRFCISKTFRNRLGDGLYGRVDDSEALRKDRRLIPYMSLGLMEGLVRMSVELGFDYLCAVMEPTLLRLLGRLGMHFENIGPRVDYHGQRQPCYQRFDRFLKRVYAERPEVWEILTDDGRHWQALQARWGGDVLRGETA